jgi:hypothetical protein
MCVRFCLSGRRAACAIFSQLFLLPPLSASQIVVKWIGNFSIRTNAALAMIK